MPIGSFDLPGGPANLAYQAQAPGVYLYRPGQDKPFTWLPNVVCVRIDERAGPAPHVASFRYLFDDAYANVLNWPSRIEDVWPLDAAGPYVVRADDRIVVSTQNPDGTPRYLFDGFAQIPQADATERSEGASFTAISVAAREFDSPISGRVQRNSDPTGIQDTSGQSDVQIDLPCRFNPADESYGDDGGFRANKTPDNADTVAQTDADGNTTRAGSPVFVDDGIEGRQAAQSPAYWSISDAIKYILATENPKGTYTQYPALSTLDDLLATGYSSGDTGPINASNITTAPLAVRDYDASNKPWPEAVAELLGYAGFVMRWDLGTGLDGLPQTIMRIYRRDMLSTSPVRPLFLDAAGNSLAQGSLNNVCQLHLARDTNSIINAWQVETNQRQVEISVYLAPLFQIAAGDAATPKNFNLSYLQTNTTDAGQWRKYRWYGVDECGDGFWAINDRKWVTNQPFNFAQVFPPNDDGTPSYAVRYRPALGHLAMSDSLGKPVKARLDVAFGVSNNGPIFAFQNDSIKWFNVVRGWELLDDRLGIKVTAMDPDDWTTGSKDGGPAVIRGVQWWADPSKMGTSLYLGGQTIQTNGYPPLLRLTCVIEDDLRMPISVGKRVGSPTQFARWRVADGRDHFQYTSIDPSSMNYATIMAGGGAVVASGDPIPIRDDTKAAENHARALQRANEMPPLAGSVTIPGTAYSYEVGDRINTIVGRGINLYQNTGQSQGEQSTYPVVVGRSFQFDPQVYTTLQLSDFRGEYHAHRRHYAHAGGNDY